jgi:hypothetical protein
MAGVVVVINYLIRAHSGPTLFSTYFKFNGTTHFRTRTKINDRALISVCGRRRTKRFKLDIYPVCAIVTTLREYKSSDWSNSVIDQLASLYEVTSNNVRLFGISENQFLLLTTIGL